jgi:hypothetical protein
LIAFFEHVTETGNDLPEYTGWEARADPDDQASAGSHREQRYRMAREEAVVQKNVKGKRNKNPGGES